MNRIPSKRMRPSGATARRASRVCARAARLSWPGMQNLRNECDGVGSSLRVLRVLPLLGTKWKPLYRSTNEYLVVLYNTRRDRCGKCAKHVMRGASGLAGARGFSARRCGGCSGNQVALASSMVGFEGSINETVVSTSW